MTRFRCTDDEQYAKEYLTTPCVCVCEDGNSPSCIGYECSYWTYRYSFGDTGTECHANAMIIYCATLSRGKDRHPETSLRPSSAGHRTYGTVWSTHTGMERCCEGFGEYRHQRRKWITCFTVTLTTYRHFISHPNWSVYQSKMTATARTIIISFIYHVMCTRN
jgi:hypothetical protein